MTEFMKDSESNRFPKARPSRSADASLRGELVRLRQLSVEERIREALKLQRQFSELQPVREENCFMGRDEPAQA